MAHPTGFEPVTFGIGMQTYGDFCCFLFFTTNGFCDASQSVSAFCGYNG